MKTTKPERSRGSALLARVGARQDDIAMQVGVSRVAVSHWLKGATKPSIQARGLLLAAYAIPITSWDEPIIGSDHGRVRVSGRPIPVPRVAERAIATFGEVPDGVLEKAAALEQMAHELMTKLQSDLGATPLEQAKVMASIAATLNLLAKLTGQFELGARLLRLPMWKKIERALERALTEHPDAAASVAAELRKLDEAA